MKVLNDLLNYKDMKIYQDDQYFKFSLDGVLLANFVKFRFTDKKILDIGAGTGIISLILSTKIDRCIDAVEIQSELCELFADTISYNSLDHKINLICADIKNYSKDGKYLNQYDVIVSNPPYYDGIKNKNEQKFIARSNSFLTLDELLLCSKRLLKNHGNLFLVFDADQFDFLYSHFQKHNFSIKTIQFVHYSIKKNASIVLIHAMKNGGYGTKVLPPFILYDEGHNMNLEYENIFQGG